MASPSPFTAPKAGKSQVSGKSQGEASFHGTAKSQGLGTPQASSPQSSPSPFSSPFSSPFGAPKTLQAPPVPSVNRLRYFGTGLTVFLLWYAAYSAIVPLSQWLTFSLFGFAESSQLGHSLQFFVYDTAKILLLLLLMVYVIAWLRAALNVERVRNYLEGTRRGVGYVFGAVFGAITPFCSCSSIPLFLGFTMAHIPLGITMAFLITSPIINEVAVVLLWGLLGWKFTLVYVAVGLLAGIVGGLIIDALHAERWLQAYVLKALNAPKFKDITGARRAKIGLMERHRFAYDETHKIFRRVWKWVVAGVALGAFLHGYVPQEWVTEHMSAGNWWSVPAAVALGIPLYSNVTGIVPVMESLLVKGLPVGTTLAFCMSTVAASLPEMLMLKQVMRWQLLALFFGILLVLFTLVGYVLNALPAWFL